MTDLTQKETVALKAIVENALESMGGKEAKDLQDDNFSWFSLSDVKFRTDLSRFQIAGLMGSLLEKMVVDTDNSDAFRNVADWCLTEDGIVIAMNLGM